VVGAFTATGRNPCDPMTWLLHNISILYRHIITAAHCFFEDPSTQFDVKNIEVVAGAYNLASPGHGEQRRGIASRTLYPGYKLYPGYNDVAVLTLASPLTLSKGIKPIRIATVGEEPAGMLYTAFQFIKIDIFNLFQFGLPFLSRFSTAKRMGLFQNFGQKSTDA